MNSLIESEFPLRLAQRERYELMAVLTDSDLAYKLPGDNPTFGELCLRDGRHRGQLHSIVRSLSARLVDSQQRARAGNQRGIAL